MSDLRELIKEAELADIRPLGLFAKLARGPAPAMGQTFTNDFNVRSGVVREGEHVFAVVFFVDCRSRRGPEDQPFARFAYRVAIRYRVKQAWPDELLGQYAQTNAAVHAWPYARQFIHSASTQLGLSPVLLPPLRVGQPPAGSNGLTWTPTKPK